VLAPILHQGWALARRLGGLQVEESVTMTVSTNEGKEAAARRPRPPQAGERRVYAAAAMLALLTTAVMVGKYLHHDWKDVPVWYDVGWRVLTNQALVGLASYRYPPTFAVLISPLCALPFGVFFFLWYGVNAVLCAVAVRQTARLVYPSKGVWQDSSIEGWSGFRPQVDTTGPPLPWLAGLMVVIYAIDNLYLGQTNILVMVLVYGSFLYLLRNKEWLCGVPLGLSIAIKVFTVPLIAYLLYRRRWRAAASSVLSCTFFLLVFPAPFRGLDRNLQEVGLWGKRVVEPYLSKGKAGDWGQHALDFGNQSVQAVAHRYLTHVDANVAARRDKPMYVNFASLKESQVNRVVLAAFLALGLVFIAACGWKRPGTRDQEVVEYALAITLVLLASAIAWTYFFVMMLLPLAAAVRLAREGEGMTRGSRGALWAGMAIFATATLLLHIHYLRALGSVCFAAVVVYVAMVGAAWQMRRQRL
jgi:hypothetical protein